MGGMGGPGNAMMMGSGPIGPNGPNNHFKPSGPGSQGPGSASGGPSGGPPGSGGGPGSQGDPQQQQQQQQLQQQQQQQGPGGGGGSGPGFKSSPFLGPTTADPNYAQQFHNFQQQLYATNTRSQMNNQAMGAGNPSFFGHK